MIARLWCGRVPVKHAIGFENHLMQGIAEYRAQSGCVAVQLLKRADAGMVEFLLVSIWISAEAINAFAGPEPAKAVLYRGDEEYELQPDLTVRHYELVPLRDEGGDDAKRK